MGRSSSCKCETCYISNHTKDKPYTVSIMQYQLLIISNQCRRKIRLNLLRLRRNLKNFVFYSKDWFQVPLSPQEPTTENNPPVENQELPTFTFGCSPGPLLFRRTVNSYKGQGMIINPALRAINLMRGKYYLRVESDPRNSIQS